MENNYFVDCHLWMSLFPQFCQVGNFSIHVALRNLKPPGEHSLTRHIVFLKQPTVWGNTMFYLFLPISGSKIKKIPYPTKNPFTWMFWLVSCPNYTYEVIKSTLTRNRTRKYCLENTIRKWYTEKTITLVDIHLI